MCILNHGGGSWQIKTVAACSAVEPWASRSNDLKTSKEAKKHQFWKQTVGGRYQAVRWFDI